MDTATWNSSVTDKIQDLCQTVLDGAWFTSIQARMDAFQKDGDAQARIQAVNEKGEFLQHKQSQGLPIAPDEIAEFERLREDFFSNPVARGFVEAQEEVHEMKNTVERHLAKTFELGRLPRSEDLQGGCGSGCGCGH